MLNLYNTRTKKVEPFEPLNDKTVTLYACGPTVYDYAHIGNFRTYVMTDLLVRTLTYFGYNVNFVENITDVGHLVSDNDTGEDKLEKGSKREGKSAWDIAAFYTDAFIRDSRLLHLVDPAVRPKPTEHIREQIAMVETLLAKGFAYRIDDGIYFDTSKFKGYGELTGQDPEELKAGARVEFNPQKRNVSDFALWKFSPKDQKRQMEWDSPWGVGFPGWHIECSAMSMKYLGPQIDIHTGGADLIPVHHTNEIAQSEAATGTHPFVRFWVHGQFIQVDGQKMSKSKGNFYRLEDITAKGFHPLSLRYLYLTAHYRAFLNFTWDAVANAEKSLKELWRQTLTLRKQTESGSRTALSEDKLEKADAFRKTFDAAIGNDLNIPQALAVVWATVKSNIPSGDRLDLLYDFDQVLGLGLRSLTREEAESADVVITPGPVQLSAVPKEVRVLIDERRQAKQDRKYDTADMLRKEIESHGYILEDTPDGTVTVRKK